MLSQSDIEFWTVHSALIVVLINVTLAHAKIVNNVVGVTRNLSVVAVEDRSHLDGNEGDGVLKLSISWLPPSWGRQPSSYSIQITSLPSKLNDGNASACPEESLYHTTENGSRLNVVLPENRFLSDAPELNIAPSCTYEIKIHANPRSDPKLESPAVNYTVPECVGRRCGCTRAKEALPVPRLHVEKQPAGDILIRWNTSSEDFNVRSYVVSFGVPLLISTKGLPVYNISRISVASATDTSFLWSAESGEDFAAVYNGGKILVAAEDERGCLGKEGTYVFETVRASVALRNEITWLVFFGVIGLFTAVLGIFGAAWVRDRKKYRLLWSGHPSKRPRGIATVCARGSRFGESLLRKRNALYVEQEIEDAIARGEADHFEVSFARLTFTRELGKGQFGKVHLASVDGCEEPRVAVKLSLCEDTRSESTARAQLLEEIAMMKAAGAHTHLVRLIGCCTLPNNPVCVILEYMAGGDLLAHLHRTRESLTSGTIFGFQASTARSPRPSETETLYTTLGSEPPLTPTTPTFSNPCSNDVIADNAPRYVNVTEESEGSGNRDSPRGSFESAEFLRFALEIARGMEHLEGKGIVHRDLAARNILLDAHLTLKISDFGLSRNGIYVMTDGDSRGVRRLPIRWMSPEALQERAFSAKSDVWSFAIVLWEIGTLGAFPYPNVRDDQLLRHVLRREGRLTRPESVSSELYEVMRACWASLPAERPSFAQLVRRLRALGGSPHALTARNNPCYTSLPPTREELQESLPDSVFADS